MGDAWELHSRKEVEHEGETYFYERWVHPPSKSGIIFFSDRSKDSGRKIYVVEGYGVGTINPKTFKEIASMAPIQRTEWLTEEEGRAALERLKEENAPSTKTE